MFDLISFIRQLLPPPLRQPVILGLVRVLYSPVMALFDAVQQASTGAVGSASTTGQVAVLEDLLNQTIFGSGVGAAYILDGDGVAYDFQVVLPAGLSVQTISQINALLATHHLLGKRYIIFTQGALDDRPVNAPAQTVLTWVTGFPYQATDGSLHIAINERGTYRVQVNTGSDAPLVDDLYAFSGPAFDLAFSHLDTTKTYSVTIGGVLVGTAKVPPTAPTTPTDPTTPTSKGLTRMGYSRFADSHQTSLWFITDRPMKATISQVSGSSSGDGWSTSVARTIDTTQTLREWTSGLRVNPAVNGQGGILDTVIYFITITESDGSGPVTYRWAPQNTDTNGILDIALNPTTIPLAPVNHAPVVANAPAQFTINAPGDQVYTLPANTFSDPDGDMLTLSASALTAGVVFNANNRTLTFPANLANSTYSQTITATDTAGASVSVQVSIVLNRPAAGSTANLDAILGPETTYVGRLDMGWASKPDVIAYEIVPGSFDGRFARIRRVGAYDPSGQGFVKVKFKERYCDPSDVATFWIECGKPFVIKEYHIKNGVGDINQWDRQENWFDSCYEYGGVIN